MCKEEKYLTHFFSRMFTNHEYLLDDQSTEKLQLESLSSNGYFHSGLLEVFNVPEFAKILIYGNYFIHVL